MLFYNDIMALSALHRAPRFAVVDYSDIQRKFPRLARLLNRIYGGADHWHPGEPADPEGRT